MAVMKTGIKGLIPKKKNSKAPIIVAYERAFSISFILSVVTIITLKFYKVKV